MANLISRVLLSKKKVEALSGIVAAFVLTSTGHDLTEPFSQVVVGFFGLLVVVQAALDWKWGSHSDGTGA